MTLQKIEAADLVKSDDGTSSIDTFLRQAMGKEPYVSLNKANGSSVQWNQLAYLPGWPLLYPMKIQMQKCDKCSREFCSSISYRRHLRLHRRKLNLDKDSATKSRGLLLAFWDKLAVEETMEIMSVDDISLEGVSGSSIIKALASLIRKPGYTSLPQSYVKSGSVLLDIVEGRPWRFPISSEELFKVLDDASENTFLCAGTAESLQKFVFNGDAGKIGVEIRNLIACTSFLVELKLVKACLADKDSEALRYQKLLVDEEEAAQKRQGDLMEKKRQKKLRQKEQRAKKLGNADNDDSVDDNAPSPNAEDDDSQEETLPSPTSSSPANDYESTLETLDILPDATPTPEHSQPVNVERNIFEDQENSHQDLGSHQIVYPDSGSYQNSEHRRLHRDGQRRWQAQKMHRHPNGLHTSHNNQAFKPGNQNQKHASSRNSKGWTVKPKSETDEGGSKPNLVFESPKLPCEENQERKILIGSIPIPLGNHATQGQDAKLGGVSESFDPEASVPVENGICGMHAKGEEETQGTTNGPAVVLCGPITTNGTSEVGSVLRSDSGETRPTCVVETGLNGCKDKSGSCVEGGHQGSLKFSSHFAQAFLSQRWKEAVTADHVELVLFPEDPPRHSAAHNDSTQETFLSPELDESSILRSAENCLPVRMTTTSPTVKSKARAKPKKSSKVKYIQKQSGF